MSEQWIVLLRTGSPEEIVVYGPMDAEAAGEFAAFLTAEVDPAVMRKLRSPTHELLGFWRAKPWQEPRPELERSQ